MNLPFCTSCDAPRTAVFECADGTTRCSSCIDRALEAAEPKVCGAFMATHSQTGMPICCELREGHVGVHTVWAAPSSPYARESRRGFEM